jgi:hypothetical protein
MKVIVEWVDGEIREYPNVDAVTDGNEVLRLYGYPVGGHTPKIAAIPLYQVREWKRADQ